MTYTSRVLYISYTSPVPAKIGPSRRHYHVLDQLARFYDVHLLALGTPWEQEKFREAYAGRVPNFDYAAVQHKKPVRVVQKVWRTLTRRCDFLPAVEPNLRRRLGEVTTVERFDAVILSGSLLFRLPLPGRVPVVGDTHNVESDVLKRTSQLAESYLRRQYARWQASCTFLEERRCSRGVDLLFATSDRDRHVLETAYNVENIVVIPNGVDVTEFSPSYSPGEPGAILFTGLMSYYPNQQGIRWFLDEIFPLISQRVPSAKLIVAGARPPAWLMKRRSDILEVTGEVSDMRPYFARARIVIVPLMIGGGTRVKILEAQAMARPVISTALGAEGLDVRDGQTILIANDPRSFAAQVSRLLNDVGLATEIGANGRRYVTRFYDWNRIGERLEGALRERIGLVPTETSIAA